MKGDQRLLEVIWRDTSSWGDWHETNHKDDEPIECVTVGYVVRETKRDLVLAQTFSRGGKVTNTMAIPKSTITSKKRFRGPLVRRKR